MAKNNKVQTIVETEPVAIEKEAIIDSTEVKDDEVIDVEVPEVIVEEKTEEPKVKAPVNDTVELEILVAFTDKYTKVDYTVGKVVTFENARAKELLSDNRKLVKMR